MALLSTLLFAVGPAVGKALLKILLDDYPFLGELAPDMLDLLKEKAATSHNERQQGAQVAAIGAAVAKRMRPAFDAARLDNGERAALVREVVLTLEGANPELLVHARLDQGRVEQSLLNSRPTATQDLSPPAAVLYRQMIGVAAEALVGVAAELVGYATMRDKVLLGDSAKVVELVNTLLQRPDEESERFKAKYRDVIGRELNKLEMFGVRRLKDALKRQPLSVAYVTAEVTRSERGPGDEPDRKLLEALLDEAPRHPEEQRRNLTGPIDRVLACERRIVVRGDAGSGKTTLLQWIAVTAAARRFEGPLHLWNNTVPFFIRLRQAVSGGFPMPENYIGQVAPHLNGSLPRPGWVHEQLEQGRAVVLIDGVDELPQGKREPFLAHLQDLVRDYPHARYIITSRPTAVGQRTWPEWHEWVQETGFTEVAIQQMGQGAIEHFIEHWHAAYAEGTSDADERTEVQRACPHLKQLLPQRPALRQLASNPLLCAMICALHLDRRNTLPSERIKLYQECVDMLLEQRDAGRGIDMGDYPTLGNRQKLTLLQDLAYRMLRNGESELPVDRVEQRFADFLPRLGADGGEAARVRGYFVQRSGLLREPVEGYLDFAHRTFQEFFTACEIAEDGEVGFLLNHADDDQWRETITLAAGLLRRREVDTLLRGLISPEGSLQRRSLALACLETAVDVDPALEHAIFAATPELFPPWRSDHQRLVAAAGERAIPYLLPDKQPNIAAMVACIRTLALIGGEKALAAIVGYRAIDHEAIQQALVAAWTRFDLQEYALRILSDHTWVSVSDPALLPYLKLLPALKQLDISGDKINDIGPLAGLGQLQRLSFYNTQVKDLGPLARLEQLQQLDLVNTPVRDLGPLAGLGQLQQLDLVNTPVRDLGPLAGLGQLRQLSLVNTQVRDLELLVRLGQLQQLSLSYTQVGDLGTIAGLAQLQQLVFFSTQVRDLEPLVRLGQLRQLSLSYTSVRNLEPLAGLVQLQRLSLSHMPVRDLGLLTGLVQLQRLSLVNTEVRDLGPLAGLGQLRQLSLVNTPVSDLGRLAGLGQLQQLDLVNTQVEDLGPLAGLGQLQQLVLGNTPVEDLGPLAGLGQLQRLDLVNTPVEDLGPLAGLGQLQQLVLGNTPVEDLGPLVGLGQLQRLNLRNTQVTDLRPLAQLPNLTWLDID